MNNDILTLADTSKLLSLPESEVAALLEAGELPGRQVGPHWYVSRNQLLLFIERRDSGGRPSRPQQPLSALPPRVLAPNWRCDECETVYPPEVTECRQCGTIRNIPLMGYRLPPSAM